MSDKRLVKVQEFDRSTLLDIWMDGFVSGLASAARTLTNCSGEEADQFADRSALSMRNDPAVMETIRREVLERVMGMVDDNPATKELKVNFL